MKDDNAEFSLLFTSMDDWRHNARIPQSSVAKRYLYAEGYRLAADTLVEHCQDSGESQDFLVYPIVFLYRHYLELLLKLIIADGRTLLDSKTGFPEHHRLNDLWREAKALTRRTWNTQDPPEMKKVDHVIAEFARVDPKGDVFRYAVSKDGRSSLPHIGHINLRHLGDCLRQVSGFLEGVSDGISVHLESKRDDGLLR